MKQVFALMVVAIATTSYADSNVQDLTNTTPINVQRHVLGSGQPGDLGTTFSLPVLSNNIYHGPQYMPYFPTAATIWPRVIEVKCTDSDYHRAHSDPSITTIKNCEGYNWAPSMGRAEYLFVTPVIVEKPKTIEKIVVVPGPERIILKEVPIKKKKE